MDRLDNLIDKKQSKGTKQTWKTELIDNFKSKNKTNFSQVEHSYEDSHWNLDCIEKKDYQSKLP